MKRAWKNEKHRIKTKALIYQTSVLSTLLYGSETWALYAGQEKRLNSFHMKCLRNISKVKGQDRIPNTEMLKRAYIQSLYPIMRSWHLRWLGHVAHMDNSRIPNRYYVGSCLRAHTYKGHSLCFAIWFFNNTYNHSVYSSFSKKPPSVCTHLTIL